jgi:hypothetical protein
MSQNRSNCAFRYGFLHLDTDSPAQSGFNSEKAVKGKNLQQLSFVSIAATRHLFHRN